VNDAFDQWGETGKGFLSMYERAAWGLDVDQIEHRARIVTQLAQHWGVLGTLLRPWRYGINRDAQSAPPPTTIDPTSGMMIQVMI
jgi:hypothetical protein